MITFEQVQQAKVNPQKATELYRVIFYDGSTPKLRMWLVNKGVPFKDIDDVESSMREEFMVRMYKYNYEKVPFEKYCWTAFRHSLLNWFKSRNFKKNSAIGFDDVVYNHNEDGEHDNEIEVNLGFIPREYGEINNDNDLEIIFQKLTRQQATICRMIYYSDWERNEIIEYLGISKERYHKEVKKIRLAFKEYYSERF